ncbi:hypothetical protein FB007_12263 [Sinorhizobium medicae]|nr:hypothetical protein FB007_12263 [Sinorhizobium medicae]
MRLARGDGDLVLFFPITTKQPEQARFAAEIPAIEKRRAGLDADLRLWIILDEFNTDIIGRSFYIEPEPPIGRFSKAFFLPLLREFIARRRSLRSAGLDSTHRDSYSNDWLRRRSDVFDEVMAIVRVGVGSLFGSVRARQIIDGWR